MLYAMRLIPGNDPDALADRLAEDLAAVGPLLGDPLAPVPVLIPNAGLRDWLRQALAERLGVCAGIDLLTPAAFTDCWLPDRLGVPRIPDEDQTWRLMALLAGDERDPLRRFRLAGIHADCLRRYRLHRPEWLRAWRDSDDDGVQARLWHGLVAAGADPLAAWDRLLEAAETGENAPTFLAGFATADLAPEVLRLLALLGGHGRVHLYTLQPVAGDWTDQRTRRRRLQDDDPDDHPLLGDWGVAGRGFLRRADDAGAVWSDRGAFAEPAGDRLLDRIRRGMAEARVPDPAPVADEDDSLTFHATHGPRRTLEAAKHQLVRWFAADPGLAPHEVALLCPDPALFAPLARAVFADAGDGPAIPLDAPDRRGDEGLAGVLLRLLELVPGRWEATAVLDLLGCAPVAEAWDLDGEALARIRAWCDGAVLRWGVDAAHRADLGLPGTRHGTWRHGLARIQAALWAGDDGAAAAAAGEPGWEAAWPAAGIS
ncbi:MAG: hypothetical protein RLZZ127_2504, partial [Planctomycetota bacterium]